MPTPPSSAAAVTSAKRSDLLFSFRCIQFFYAEDTVMGLSLESIVVLDLDAALEGTDRQRRRRQTSASADDENADVKSENQHGDDQHDEQAEEQAEEQYAPSQQRDKENMPPASTRPLYKWSFKIALFLAGVFVIIMMGLAGRHGKYLRGQDDSTATAAASSTVPITASARTDAGSISGAAPVVEDNDETETRTSMRDPTQEDLGAIFAIGVVEGDDLDTASPTVVPTPKPSNEPSSMAPTMGPTTIAPSHNPTRSPSLSPTKVPTAQPQVAPTIAPPSAAQGGCKDDTTYLSPLGMDCSQHATLNCNLFDDIGVLTPEQTAELLQKCPVSCKVPPKECIDVDEMTDTNVEVQESCQPGWSPTCQDNMMFRSSPYGQPCEYFREIDCHGLFVIGYKVEQIADIMNQCPCACEISCGTVRIKDIGTGGGASKSIHIETPAPTDSPTPNPTSSPSYQPTTAAPSSSPTDAPTTAKPTTSPSSVPATSPPSSAVVSSSFSGVQVVENNVDISQNNNTMGPQIHNAVQQQQGQEAQAPEQSVGITSVQAGAVAGIMALSVLLSLLFFYIAQKKRDRGTDRRQTRGKADLEASYDEDVGEYEIEEQEVDEESVPDVNAIDSDQHLESDGIPLPIETEEEEEEDEYEIVVLSEDGHETAVVDIEQGDGTDSSNAPLKSCLRDSEQVRQQQTQQQERQHPQQQQQSVTWGNCRVRHVENIAISQSDSFQDVSPPPSQEDDKEWPTGENVRFYQLGMLKALSQEAMHQMQSAMSSFSSSFG